MKSRFIFLFTVSLVSINTFGQRVNYDVIKNEPVEPKISVALDLFQLDANTGWPNLRTDNMSFNIGMVGYVKVLPMLEVDYNLHKGFLTLGRMANENYPGNTDLNAGVNFLLPGIKKTKSTKVVLASETTRSGNTETTNTTYIMVPAQWKRRLGFRGGVKFKNGPFNYQDYIDESTLDGLDELGMMSTGIYGGVMLRSIRNIVIDSDNFGLSFNSLGSDLYLDVIVNPINRFVDVNNNNEVVSQEVKDFQSVFPIGFRIGYETFQVEQRTVIGKRFGITWNGEFGYQPYRGIFINAGIGLSVFRM
tara:strand:- start:26242 stop:27156 length:915 start_codon:yes stop_codon:yes gene_type:complete